MNDVNFLAELISCFEKLPGVGKKTATRYAYHLVEKLGLDEVEEISKIMVNTKKSIKHCKMCGMLTINEVCEICSDGFRDKSKIVVVKDTKDVFAIEKTKNYNGLYHVLGGLISPLDGVGPKDLTINLLEERSKSETVKEIIIATSFTPAGETTALYLDKILNREKLMISRIGYGLPAGGDIEYIDELTLTRALQGRNKI